MTLSVTSPHLKSIILLSCIGIWLHHFLEHVLQFASTDHCEWPKSFFILTITRYYSFWTETYHECVTISSSRNDWNTVDGTSNYSTSKCRTKTGLRSKVQNTRECFCSGSLLLLLTRHSGTKIKVKSHECLHVQMCKWLANVLHWTPAPVARHLVQVSASTFQWTLDLFFIFYSQTIVFDIYCKLSNFWKKVEKYRQFVVCNMPREW